MKGIIQSFCAQFDVNIYSRKDKEQEENFKARRKPSHSLPLILTISSFVKYSGLLPLSNMITKISFRRTL